MNLVLKIVISLWLLASAIVGFLGCAAIGFFFAFTQYRFMYDVTPFMSYTALFVSLYCIKRTISSNPADKIGGFLERLGKRLRVLGRAKNKSRKSSRK